MKNSHVIRAWKDEEYRLNLSNGELALVPEHPSGAIELTDADLGGASGGSLTLLTVSYLFTVCCPTAFTCSTCNFYRCNG